MPAFPKLRFQLPSSIEEIPGANRLLVTEMGGKIFTFPKRADVGQADLVVDLRELVPAVLAGQRLALFDADLNLVKTYAAASLDGKTSSRVSAVYDAAPRSSFVVALKDLPELWEISYDPKAEPIFDGLVHDYKLGEGVAKPGYLGIRRTPLDQPLDDFFFDQRYRHVLGATRPKGAGAGAPTAQVVNLDVRRKIAELPIAGMPHLGSGITFAWHGTTVLMSPNLKGSALDVIDMKTWKPVKTVATPTQPVVVAAADLPIGSEIKKEDLQVISFPAGQTPQGIFSNPQDILGRGLIVSVVKSEPILEAKLAPKEAGAGLPPVIPEGMRAVSVRVNEVVGVAGYVLPGTRVDVVATASPTNQPGDTTSKVVLANVQVLTAGTRMEQDQEQGKPMQVTVVTLLVTPEQAERLALASNEGKIQLALRNPLDQGAPVTPGIKPAILMGAVRAPQAAPQRSATGPSRKASGPVTMDTLAPPPPPTVEIIRGDKRQSEVIK